VTTAFSCAIRLAVGSVRQSASIIVYRARIFPLFRARRSCNVVAYISCGTTRSLTAFGLTGFCAVNTSAGDLMDYMLAKPLPREYADHAEPFRRPDSHLVALRPDERVEARPARAPPRTRPCAAPRPSARAPLLVRSPPGSSRGPQAPPARARCHGSRRRRQLAHLREQLRWTFGARATPRAHGTSR
jgi:hypothetical protein